MIAPLMAAEQAYEPTKTVHKPIPGRTLLGDLIPGQHVLDLEKNLLNRAILITPMGIIARTRNMTELGRRVGMGRDE